MKKDNLPEAIGIIVSLGGLIVMAAWLLGIEALKSILPDSVSMKFSTALGFFLSGIELYFVARFQKKDRDLPVIVIPIISMVILLIMASLLASTLIGVSVGVEEMFVKDSINPIRSVTPGRPSIATMIDFTLIAMAGVLTIINIAISGRMRLIFGTFVAITGLIAILGYIINLPLLYSAIPGKSTAMAIHTAVLFVLLGAGVVLARKR